MDHEKHNITNFRRNFTIINNLLINKFNLHSISPEIMNTVSDYIISSKNKSEYDKLIIDLSNESTRILRKFNVIEGKIRDEGDKFVYSFENNIKSIYEKCLGKELNSIELYNNQNYEISFDKFKEYIFELPFIPDLIRATCCFHSRIDNKFIRTFSKVRVEISGNDKGSVKSFIFSDEKVIYLNSRKIVKIIKM
jgi:hypothetical protein